MHSYLNVIFSIYILLHRHRLLIANYILLRKHQLIAQYKINLGQTILCHCTNRLLN